MTSVGIKEAPLDGNPQVQKKRMSIHIVTNRKENINMYYTICTLCGAHLDPGEHCDCKKIKLAKNEEIEKMTTINSETGQYELVDRRE